MKKYDEQVLKAAVMAAKVEKSNTGGYLCSGNKFVVLHIAYQGAALIFTVEGDNEKIAKDLAFIRLKQRFSKRVRTGWTRAELDKDSLNSQKHLLFWRDHLGLVNVIRQAAALEAKIPSWAYGATMQEIEAKDKAISIFKKFVKENLGRNFGYSPKLLMRLYDSVPSAWRKAYVIGCEKNHQVSTPERKKTAARVSFAAKDEKVVYRYGRSIVCYRRGATYYIGKPSDHCVLSSTVDSEETAHERCLEIVASRKKLAVALAG